MAQARAVPDVASSYPRLARLVRILHPAEPVTEAPAAAKKKGRGFKSK